MSTTIDRTGAVQIDLDFTRAMERADLAIERGRVKANKVCPEWTGQALAHVIAFAIENHHRAFLIEEVRPYAHKKGLPLPTDNRHWGAVTRAAGASRRLMKVGTGKAATSHGSEKHLWKFVR